MQAHPVGKDWVAGYGFEIRTGECQGETLPPSLHDQRFATIGEAVAEATARLLASLDAKYPAAPGTKTEAKALAALLIATSSSSHRCTRAFPPPSQNW